VLVIKNIILYDQWQHVSGFVELRTAHDGTTVKVKHNLVQKELMLSLTAGGESHVFALSKRSDSFQLPGTIDLAREVVACVIHKDNEKVNTLASGAINLAGGAANHPTACGDSPLQGGELVSGSYQEQALGKSRQLSPLLGGVAPQSGDGVVLEVTPPLTAILDDTELLPISRKTSDEKYKTSAAREVDEVLRAVCTIDDQGKGICEICPYREFFFGETVKV